MDEFRRRPVNRVNGAPAQPVRSVATSPVVTPVSVPQPTTPKDAPVGASEPLTPQEITEKGGTGIAPPKKSKKKIIIWSIVAIILAGLLTLGGLWAWYQVQLSPVDSANKDRKLVVIAENSLPSQIADELKEQGVIRNQTAFLVHARLSGVQNNLQAGTYRLSPSESTPQIVDHLVNGKVDVFSLTFLPGATLADNRQVFLDAGYGTTEVDAALAKEYTSPLFQTKPATADLEGYIYGETYSFGTNTSVEAILTSIFDHYYGIVEENGLVAKYKAQNLTLFQGITLASIVQREASPGGDDMAQIASVFYNRLKEGMPLGSDVTYQYIADKTGVTRDPTLDSPYNTRRYPGLPPGPIAAPGLKALIAVGSPASSDYLYFLSGDDNITYFAKTLDQHEANIRNHCQEKCKII